MEIVRTGGEGSGAEVEQKDNVRAEERAEAWFVVGVEHRRVSRRQLEGAAAVGGGCADTFSEREERVPGVAAGVLLDGEVAIEALAPLVKLAKLAADHARRQQ